MEEGTVIHGTGLTSDLIDAFTGELEAKAPEMAQRARLVFSSVYKALDEDQDGVNYGAYSEDAGDLLLELLDCLDVIAPSGFYFGTHPGDGSDYGWWRQEAAIGKEDAEV